MATESFATELDPADDNDPGLLIKVADDLTTTLVTPAGKAVPISPAMIVRFMGPLRRDGN